jgi:hypothetical protein
MREYVLLPRYLAFKRHGGLVQCRGSGFVYGCHQIWSRRLLDHMPCSGDAVQFALLDLVMQCDGLLVDVDQTIILTRMCDRCRRRKGSGLRKGGDSGIPPEGDTRTETMDTVFAGKPCAIPQMVCTMPQANEKCCS